MQKTIFKLFILILIISACSTNKILSKKNQMNKLDCIKHCQTAKIMNPECNCLLKKEEKKISIKDQVLKNFSLKIKNNPKRLLDCNVLCLIGHGGNHCYCNHAAFVGK